MVEREDGTIPILDEMSMNSLGDSLGGLPRAFRDFPSLRPITLSSNTIPSLPAQAREAGRYCPLARDRYFTP